MRLRHRRHRRHRRQQLQHELTLACACAPNLNGQGLTDVPVGSAAEVMEVLMNGKDEHSTRSILVRESLRVVIRMSKDARRLSV